MMPTASKRPNVTLIPHGNPLDSAGRIAGVSLSRLEGKP